MKKPLIILLILIIAGLGVYLYLAFQFGPYGKGGTVYLPKGMKVSQIAEELKKNGLIRSEWAFKWVVRYRGVQAKLQAGEYEFKPGVDPGEIVEKLVRGERVIRRLVIPEGYNFSQIVAAIEKAGIARAADILPFFHDPKVLQKLKFPAISLEGYLFPASYEYDRGTTAPGLVDQMIAAFQRNFDKELRERALQIGWSIPQVVTLASIIEKETGLAAERPLVSSVYHNRIRSGMPLQADPTVIYGLKNFAGNIRKADLANPHPYNTYVHVGLPPGPIASPGKASLKAALNPAQTNYLFFVAKKDGSHAFSTTLEEHEANVRLYQLGQGPAPTPSPSQAKPALSPTPTPAPVYNRPIMKPSPMVP